METIWKFDLTAQQFNRLQIPIGAEILTVQTQNNQPKLWALVDTNAEKELRIFEIYGTGHPMRNDIGVSRKYINTFQMEAGNLVFHLFEYTGI